METIEIPFGARDSELIGFEYTIPKSYKAEIKDGKVIVKKIESKDEKIIKIIRNCLNQYNQGIVVGSLNAIDYANCIDWLKKQGEQKDVSQKELDDAYLKGISDAKNEIEKQYEANYQIRKDIATFIFNYRGDIKDRAKWMNYLGIKVSFVEKQGEHDMGISEAAKQKLEDNLNKALEKETPESCNEFLDEQKPVEPNWCHHKVDLSGCSEEYCKAYYDGWNNCNMQHDQCKSEQKSIEWSEEDKFHFKSIESTIEYCIKEVAENDDARYLFNEDLNWLKSLRPQEYCEYNPYKEAVDSIAEMCEKYKLPLSNLSDFLDNVKVKCKEAKEYDAIFPQSHWKPSEAQIRMIEKVVNGQVLFDNQYNSLKELLEQLKAL